jgi:TrmH family RNA methyltransferase
LQIFNNPVMIPSSELKLIRSLGRKKMRDQYQLYVVEGDKMVRELISGPVAVTRMVRTVYATADRIGEYRHLLRGSGIGVSEITDPELRKVSHLVTPQQVLALVSIPETKLIPEVLSSALVLGFESIRDPGNLGTIIRTADWFGIGHIICTPDSVDLYNPKVVQATMGSLARVRVYYLDIESLLKEKSFQGKPVYGTFLSGQNIYETSLEKDPLFLFGNESHGLSGKYDPWLSARLSIPPFAHHTGSESLNLASSVAVICSEIRRRG